MTPLVIVALIPGLTAAAWNQSLTHLAALALLLLAGLEWRFREFFARFTKLQNWAMPALIVINLLFFGFWVSGLRIPERGLTTIDVTVAYVLSSVLAIVLSNTKNPADRIILFFMSLLLFIIAAIEKSPVFLPMFFLYLVLATHVLMRLRYARYHEQGIQIFGYINRFLLMILPPTVLLSAALFVFMPRPFLIVRKDAKIQEESEPNPKPPSFRTTGETGLDPLDQTATLTLEEIEKMLPDPRPIGTLRLNPLGSERPKPPLYLRGEVLDRYTAGSWSSTHALTDAKDATDGREDRKISLRVKRMATLRFPLVRQDIKLSLPVRKILALPEPATLYVNHVLMDKHGTFAFPDSVRPLQTYTVESHLVTPILDDIEESAEFPIRQEYTQLPEGLTRLKEAAALETRHRKTVRDKIVSLQLLLSSYSYSLDFPSPPAGADPVEFFLTRSREGLCTHFASSMVLMLRSVGIPSRLAIGFLLKEPTDDGEGFIIRKSNGHAWVEVYSGAYGWIPVDPTPPRADPVPVERPTPVAARKPLPPPEIPDRPDERWDSRILDYDRQKYILLLGDVGASVRSFVQTVVMPALPYVLLTLLTVVLFLAALFRLLPRRLRTRIQMAASGFHKTSSIDFYGRFLWVMARKRMVKEPGMTPLEFCEAVKHRVPEDCVRAITDQFYRVRYGRTLITESQQHEMDRRLTELEQQIQVYPVRES